MSTDAMVGVSRTPAPGLVCLPDFDLHAFAAEPFKAMRVTGSLGDRAAVSQLLIAWEHTAEGLLRSCAAGHVCQRARR
ncbi:hypothetical protein [Streptomyces calvus]|uniref:hypothetical protein n=1 Tax=Streptomyces calvus TaxID=67282 RepID=UPI003722DF25